MSESGTEVKVPLSVNNPEPQQTTDGETASNAHELSTEEQLNVIKSDWDKKVNHTDNDKRVLITKLKELTARTQPPEHPGALHHASEPSSTNEQH